MLIDKLNLLLSALNPKDLSFLIRPVKSDEKSLNETTISIGIMCLTDSPNKSYDICSSIDFLQGKLVPFLMQLPGIHQLVTIKMK